MRKAPAIERLPEEQVPKAYRQRRIQVFTAVYLGYAFYYLIRKNIAPALPLLMEDLARKFHKKSIADMLIC